MEIPFTRKSGSSDNYIYVVVFESFSLSVFYAVGHKRMNLLGRRELRTNKAGTHRKVRRTGNYGRCALIR